MIAPALGLWALWKGSMNLLLLAITAKKPVSFLQSLSPTSPNFSSCPEIWYCLMFARMGCRSPDPQPKGSNHLTQGAFLQTQVPSLCLSSAGKWNGWPEKNVDPAGLEIQHSQRIHTGYKCFCDALCMPPKVKRRAHLLPAVPDWVPNKQHLGGPLPAELMFCR